MDEHLEDLFNNVNHLIECQRFVMERVKFLEAKRVEISNMIQNLSNSNFKETLENEINKLEMKVSITCVRDPSKDKDVMDNLEVQELKKNIKCRYNNRGYCKSKFNCEFLHSNKICDKVLLNGKCLEVKTCLLRHPRDCRHWLGDSKGCLRGEDCMYLHISCKKGSLIKRNQNNGKSETQTTKDNNETVAEKQDDTPVQCESSYAMDEEINEEEQNVSKLISENQQLIKENNKMKIMLKNMDQEIKRLRSRTKE